MDQFIRDGFVYLDGTSWSSSAGSFFLDGELRCCRGIVIRVYKRVDLVDRTGGVLMVQTGRYAYNASVHEFHNFLRCDNAHPHPGHPDAHHRHRFDWRTGDDLPGSPEWVGSHGWPTLGDFIEEVKGWYWDHFDELNPTDV